MNRIKQSLNLICALVILAGIAVPTFSTPAAADSPNLIANPSVESVDPSNSSLPQSWAKDSWGTNTPAYSYLNTGGHSGSRSVQVKLSQYTSGDAKWYFAPVNVSGNTQYSFEDYYTATVATDVVAQYDDGNGNYTYEDLGAAASATAWHQYSASFTTPSNTKSVTIFHVINKIGTLTIDDASLKQVVTTPPVAGSNLVPNASVETANGSAPQSWTKDNWGTNTPTYSYLTTGHTGGRSVQVKLSKYTSGDAKWYFKPIAVSGATQYKFSDYYKATVDTDIVAELNDGNGNYTYEYLGTAPKSSTTWQQYSASFTTPSNTKSLTVLHVINKVGTLTLDDMALTAAAQPVPPSPSVVPNPSYETVDPANANLPQSWYAGSWGNNSTQFSYNTSGHTGSRSVGVTMSNFVDGGANWTYNAQSVEGGKTYEFSNYYQSNTVTQVLVAVNMSDGSKQYLWLGNPYTSDGAWSRFYKTFTMPAGAVSAVAYQTISANGYFKADDYVLRPYVPSGFNTPLVSVTFDDGIASQYDNGLPIMQKYGLKGTFYIISGDLGQCDPSISSICYMTPAQVKALYTAGNEIGSHTVDHPYLTTLTASQADHELADSQTALSQIIGAPVTDFASPYGDVNLSVLTASQKYYASHRGVEIGYNDKGNYNQQGLLVQDINSSTTVAQVQSYIDYAKATNTWLILMYHDIDPDTTVDPGYDTTPADFDAHMSYLKASGVPVVTVKQGLQLVAPQL